MSERKASMGDKVYRGDVVKYIRNHISLGTFMHRTVKKADEACWNLCDQLNFVPAIEEEPTRMKGKWYKPEGYPRDSYRFICDKCHDVAYFVTGNNGKKNKEDHPKCGYRFCPNCGASMSEGEEDEIN